MPRPEGQHALPAVLGGRTIVHVALLVHKGMVRVVAKNFRRLARALEVGLELIDRGRRAPVVAIGEVTLQRLLHVLGRGDALGWQAVKADGRINFGKATGAKNGDRPAEAEPG